MKNFGFFVLVFVAAACTFARPVDALQTTRAYKEVIIQIQVTPSPVPVGFTVPHRAPSARIAALSADPYHGPAMLAASTTSVYDVPMPLGTPMVIAQAPPQGNVPVTFNAKPDPNATYLHEIPHTTSLSAGYGTTVFPCVYEMYTWFSTTYSLTDWGFATTSSGAAGTYPIMNFPTASYAAWAVPSIGKTAFSNYSNSGSPGQTTWTGTANVAQQHCIDMQITVPNSQPAGFYTATVQYNLIVN
ncbi:MAG: hypothetical protein ABR591_03130 [Candidatus Velthaea sp.]